jgi:hypothetical protein
MNKGIKGCLGRTGKNGTEVCRGCCWEDPVTNPLRFTLEFQSEGKWRWVAYEGDPRAAVEHSNDINWVELQKNNWKRM